MSAYKTPSEGMKSFLIDTIKKLNGVERLENMALAKFLIEKHSGRCPFNTNDIGDSFSWLHQIGVLSYDKVYEPSGGWRLHLYRLCSEDDVERLISLSGTIHIEDLEASPKKMTMPKLSKARSGCCNNPHPVKSRKTGKRKCKNCGTPLKSREPDASASSCCNNPHPVKSRKTGKRKCKSCGKPLARKGPK